MELTLTTEFMSGTTGTSTSGERRITRRVVAPEAVARSTITRPTPPRILGDLGGQRLPAPPSPGPGVSGSMVTI